MSQQLNLLPPVKSRYNPAAVALMILGGVALALFVTWGAKHSTLATVRAEEAASTAELTTVTAQLEQRFNARAVQLNAEIDTLKPRAEEAQMVIRLADGVGKPEGFSPYFSLLTQVREDGVWLSEMSLGQAGKSLQLNGQSLNKDALLRYRERINAAFTTSGIQLTALEIASQPVGAAGASDMTTIRFTLR